LGLSSKLKTSFYQLALVLEGKNGEVTGIEASQQLCDWGLGDPLLQVKFLYLLHNF
jgi:hypothetical protein